VSAGFNRSLTLHIRMPSQVRTIRRTATTDSESRQVVLRIAAAKPISALPTRIMAAWSLGHEDGNFAEGTVTTAVRATGDRSSSLKPMVGVPARSPKSTSATPRLRIKIRSFPKCWQTHSPCQPLSSDRKRCATGARR